MLAIQNKQQIWKNILVMIGFGVLSFILGFLKFYIPGLDGGGSDMREIGVLLSVIFLPSWIYMLGVSFIASLSIPLNNLEVSTILMHCTASLFAWFYFIYIKKRTKNEYLLGGQWAIMVIAYYILFLIPTLVIVFYFFKVISWSEIIPTYKDVLFNYRFEIFATTAITTLFLVLYKIRKILEVKNEELEKALRKSEEIDKLKTAFLNNINHEIRTPLNGIIGFTSLISEPNLTEEQRVNYRDVISSSSNQLLSIISNIIDLSKINAGQIELSVDRFSINEFLASIYTNYLPIAKEKQLRFEIIKSEQGLDDTIITDRNILKQIMENLLSNAFKFTSNGFVNIYYKMIEDSIIFFIEDSGPGIAEDLQEKIFEHFNKLEINDKKLYEGVGLGLTLSKELVELLGGSIQIKSELDKGSIFSFTIPKTPHPSSH